MVTRRYWQKRIEELWNVRPIIWLAGVRRSGKTSLCRSMPGTAYFDCELPSVRRILEDPESFLDGNRDGKLVLDEIHRLDNPSELLKVAADHYPDIRIIATGSSVLGASAKFKDTLAGRKSELWLTPMVSSDMDDFGDPDLGHRLLRGGLPPFFMDQGLPEREFQEWMDAFWAKDIQELFRLERRHSFQKFTELLLSQSGGMFEATRFAKPCEVSRTTIANYLSVLEATFVVHVVRPFSNHKPTEIVSAPKVYGFDTGFIAYWRGWKELRKEDSGMLWEHFVLNEMHGRLQTRDVHYWRDKSRHEIDFILAPRGKDPIAIECKWSADQFAPNALAAFRKIHPGGMNYVVAQDVRKAFTRNYGGLKVEFCGLVELIGGLEVQKAIP
jgi:uncharacterized protein